MENIKLVPIKENEKERFIINIQKSFKKAAVEEFGDNGEEIIPREDIVQSFNCPGAVTYNIINNEEIVGGLIVAINSDTKCNELLLLFVNVDCHSKGIGYEAWKAVEALYPDTKVWETATPYFEKRNIHFYVNKCGFHIVEFYNPHHPQSKCIESTIQGGEYFFRFEKQMTIK